jgi:hypothetical protein
MKAFYGLFADVLVVIHLSYVMFAVGGQILILLGAILGWEGIRRPLFRIGHLAAVGVVAVEAAIGIDCPLTVWESALRQLAGLPAERNLSFIARIARLVVFYNFPIWVFTVMHIAFGLLVILTFLLIPPRLDGHRGG